MNLCVVHLTSAFCINPEECAVLPCACSDRTDAAFPVCRGPSLLHMRVRVLTLAAVEPSLVSCECLVFPLADVRVHFFATAKPTVVVTSWFICPLHTCVRAFLGRFLEVELFSLGYMHFQFYPVLLCCLLKRPHPAVRAGTPFP